MTKTQLCKVYCFLTMCVLNLREILDIHITVMQFELCATSHLCIQVTHNYL